MQAPSWADFLECSVCTNHYDTSTLLPISLSCGHSICKKCLTEFMTRVCPYDKTPISPNAELLPPNSALLWLLGAGRGTEGETDGDSGDFSLLGLSPDDLELYKSVRLSIKKAAVYLQPLAEPGANQVIHYLTRPMLKKLVTVVNCQFLEPDGRARVLRAARSITDRTVTELLVMHQNQQQISTLLWSAIRSRGCQFLGPVMQEEALKLILKVLEGGAFLSRKNIVLYVVQQLQQQEFHQASKTSIGHVVQLLYRASCFNVEKRDEDSSRMQLKEEFRTYEALRREHDAQIIRVAMESGLRISPEQWSALLYGDQKHKSDMQSIIDKLLSLGIATSGLSELIVAIRRSQDQHSLLEKIVPHLEKLLQVDINIDKSSPEVERWLFFSGTMAALVAMLHEYSSFMRLYMQDSHTKGPNPSQIQSGRYKTGLCPNLTKPGGCPKGDKCTYAHTEEEREKYRYLARGAKNKSRDLGKPLSGPQTVPPRTGTTGATLQRWSGDVGTKLDSSPFSSLGPSYEGAGPGYPGGGGTVGVAEGYSEYPVIAAQPQLVAYRSPHHSGPLTVSGEQLAIYDTQIDPAYFTAPRRSGSIPDEYSVVGVATDNRRYSATTQQALQNSYYATAPPTALESIKQVHADIKRNMQPHYLTDEGGQPQYPHSGAELSYLQRGGQHYQLYPSPAPQRQANSYNQDPALEQRGQQLHDNKLPDHAPQEQPVVVATSSGGSSAIYLSESGEGEEGEGREVKVGGSEGEGNGLTNQMSQLQLKDPTYYEATPYSSAVGGVSSEASCVVLPSEPYPEHSISQSALHLNHTPLQQPAHYVGAEKVTSGGRAPGGGVLEIEVMKEKIRLLESQLVREKARTAHQVAGSPSLSHHSPAHSGLVYAGSVDSYPTGQVQPYAAAAAVAARVQQVQMYPAVTAHQPTYYSPTPSYQYSTWSGPQYTADLTSGLQTVPGHVSTSYVLHQPSQTPQQTLGRSVFVQQQQPVAQDFLNKDHMLAMYLQIQEQAKPYHQPHPLPSLPSFTPTQQQSPQVGYGGRAYPTPSSFTETPYLMKPF